VTRPVLSHVIPCQSQTELLLIHFVFDFHVWYDSASAAACTRCDGLISGGWVPSASGRRWHARCGPSVIILITTEHCSGNICALLVASSVHLARDGEQHSTIHSLRAAAAAAAAAAVVKAKRPAASLSTQRGGSNLGSQWPNEEGVAQCKIKQLSLCANHARTCKGDQTGAVSRIVRRRARRSARASSEHNHSHHTKHRCHGHCPKTERAKNFGISRSSSNFGTSTTMHATARSRLLGARKEGPCTDATHQKLTEPACERPKYRLPNRRNVARAASDALRTRGCV
jgi:hypothetical protein